MEVCAKRDGVSQPQTRRVLERQSGDRSLAPNTMADGVAVNSRDDLPRVSVDSVHDWQRISDNVSAAALILLETRLQATGSSDKRDVLRPHIEQVHPSLPRLSPSLTQRKFVHRLLNISKLNLRINGRNFSEYGDDERGQLASRLARSHRLIHRPDTELFDEALDRRVWSLSDQRLNWDLVIALKRRAVPSDVENVIQDVVAKQRESDLTSITDEVTMNIDVEGDDSKSSAFLQLNNR